MQTTLIISFFKFKYNIKREKKEFNKGINKIKNCTHLGNSIDLKVSKLLKIYINKRADEKAMQ